MLPKQMNRRIGRVMYDYAMLSDGDRVIVAVSGGLDSLVLATIIDYWEKKAPISYSIEAVHIDMEGSGDVPGDAAVKVQSELANKGLSLTIIPAAWKPSDEQLASGNNKNICFQCARSRRTQLFSYSREKKAHKLALGHHKDDIIETFLMNMTCSGNISTMKPKQDLFDGRLSIIRPLAYCEKKEIDQLGCSINYTPVRSACPLSEKTKREDIHQLAQYIYNVIPGAKENIFAAMTNVRKEYLLQSFNKNK